MGLVLAAAPFEEFARDNSPVLAVIFCALLALLVVRLVVKTMTRMVLLGIILALTLFIAVEHQSITECTQTCSCTLAGVDTSIPWCNTKLPRT